MRIVIVNSKVDFSPENLSSLSTAGEVVFAEERPDFKDTIFTDDESKVVCLGPELLNWEISNNELDSINNLKAVCLPTTSYSWVDGQYLRNKGIPLTNVPHYSTESVAEYAIWMMISLAKKIPLIIKNEWKLDYANHLGEEVKGKTVGIIGLGSIGERIADLTKAMGMEVLYWSRSSRNAEFQYVELETLLENSDFIFPVLIKNEETKNVIDSDKLSKLKKGSHIVSITGDELFDLDFALTRVQSGEVGGVAFESEKTKVGDYIGNVLVTPPIAWYTKEANAEDIRIWVETVVSCVSGNPLHVVNG